MKENYLWVMWIAVAIAIIAGIGITKSTWCLWAFMFPFIVTEDT